MSNFISFDPGNSTGITFYSTTTGIMMCTLKKLQVYALLRQENVITEHTVVFAEQFRINASTHKKTAQPDATRILGALEFLCDGVGADFITHAAGEGKGFADDAYLDRMHKGIRETAKTAHEIDSFRHMAKGVADYEGADWNTFVEWARCL